MSHDPYIVFKKSNMDTLRTFDWFPDAAHYFRKLHEEHPGAEDIYAARTVSLAPMAPRDEDQSPVVKSEHADVVNNSKVHESGVQSWPEWVRKWTEEDFQYPAKRSNNDCPVVALSAVAGIPYGQAKVKSFHYGWSSTKGLQRGFLEALVEQEYNYRTQDRKDLCSGRTTPVDMRLPGNRVFFVYVPGHVFPVIDGRAFNLAGTQHRPVEAVVEVCPQEILAGQLA